MKSITLGVFLCVLALLACKKGNPSSGTGAPSGALEPDPTAGVLFTKKVRPVGSKYLEGFQNEFSFDIDAKQAGRKIRTVSMKKVEQSKRRIEVMSSSAKAVEKVRVYYLEDYKGEAQGSAEVKKKPSVVSGKTYVVEAEGSVIEVTTETGGAPSPAEVKIVKKHFKSLGQSDRISAFVPDRAVQVGEKIPVSAGLVNYMFESDDEDEVSIDSASFTFRSTRTDGVRTLGTFDMAIKVTADSKKDDIAMIMELDGKVTLDKDTSWADELTLKGPITIKGRSKAAGIEIDGKGNAKMTATITAQ